MITDLDSVYGDFLVRYVTRSFYSLFLTISRQRNTQITLEKAINMESDSCYVRCYFCFCYYCCCCCFVFCCCSVVAVAVVVVVVIVVVAVVVLVVVAAAAVIEVSFVLGFRELYQHP